MSPGVGVSVPVSLAGSRCKRRPHAPTNGATSDESKANDTLQVIHPDEQQPRPAHEASTTKNGPSKNPGKRSGPDSGYNPPRTR